MRTRDVEKVLKNASSPDGKVSSRSLKKAVDKELGVPAQRQKQAEDRRKEQEQRQRIYDEWNELSRVLMRTKTTLQDLLKDLTKVTPEGWETLAKNSPKLTSSLADVCDELAEFLRS